MEQEVHLSRNAIYLTGQKFGRLTVLWRERNRPGRGAGLVCWRCLCECGSFVLATSDALRHGQRSCGCLRTEHIRRVNSRRNA